jgi:hypothetical protein
MLRYWSWLGTSTRGRGLPLLVLPVLLARARIETLGKVFAGPETAGTSCTVASWNASAGAASAATATTPRVRWRCDSCHHGALGRAAGRLPPKHAIAAAPQRLSASARAIAAAATIAQPIINIVLQNKENKMQCKAMH